MAKYECVHPITQVMAKRANTDTADAAVQTVESELPTPTSSGARKLTEERFSEIVDEALQRRSQEQNARAPPRHSTEEPLEVTEVQRQEGRYSFRQSTYAKARDRDQEKIQKLQQENERLRKLAQETRADLFKMSQHFPEETLLQAIENSRNERK